jgi:hypothetical protein
VKCGTSFKALIAFGGIREILVLDFEVDLVTPHLDLMGSVGRWLILSRGDQKGELCRGSFVDAWAV